MSKRIFQDIDTLLEKAIGLALIETGVAATEKERQDALAKSIKKNDLHASDSKASVEEAEDEEEAESDEGEKEDALKIGTGEIKQEPAKTAAVKPGTRTSKKLAAPTENEIKNPQLKDFITKINILRGGGSLKHPQIRELVKGYIENLPAADRSELIQNLSALAQAMAGRKPTVAPDQEKAKSKKIKPGSESIEDAEETETIVVGESKSIAAIRHKIEKIKKWKS